MGIQSLETTRLSYVITDAPWLTVPTDTAGSPQRKALKLETLDPVQVVALKTAPENVARCVDASMVSLTDTLLQESLWCGEHGDRMRLPITLRDNSGTVPVTLWSTDFSSFIEKNIDELGVLFAACEDNQEGIAQFLAVLNANAEKQFRWILRPRYWKKDNGDLQKQWNVASVIAIAS